MLKFIQLTPSLCEISIVFTKWCTRLWMISFIFYVKKRAYLQEAKHIRYYFINKNKQCYALREKGKITGFDVFVCNVSLFSYLSHSLTHSFHTYFSSFLDVYYILLPQNTIQSIRKKQKKKSKKTTNIIASYNSV